MAYGIPVADKKKPDTNKTEIEQEIEKLIRKIVARYGFDAEDWAKAISSQYFLLCLAQQLKWDKKDYSNLLNICLSSFRVTYTGRYILDKEKLLITPDETNKIVQCMQKEDDVDDYYTHTAKMRATSIDSNRMYFNFHYGLLIRIVSSEDTDVLRAIKHNCLDQLMEECSLDTSDGWYPYRVPWITARILISLKAIDYSSYQKKSDLNCVIENALNSLYQRVDDKDAYWRSGVGEWVSKWESTALCLEALYVWGTIDSHKNDIRKIIEYICLDSNKQEWLNLSLDFDSEKTANDTLSGIILASVLLRISKDYFQEVYESLYPEVIEVFKNVINIINKQSVNVVRQYCTIPQILHYVIAAIQ